ncbi:MAG: ATP-binding cassette domain-containing protein [Anaerolineae bacterium]|nr:ATP-binding cassette domain-containing protein [Anaerolineae bacterium]
MPEAIATFDKVSYMYPRSTALVLRDISLEIRKGEFLGLIGPSGAGKTTLCLAFNGIVPQFYGGRFFGAVNVAGLDTLEHPISTLARYVGIVLENPETQITATSVENEIAFALENLKVPRDEILARIPRVLEAVRLEGMEHRHPQELSGGQKQRLAIAAMLAVRPSLLVLDEPTSQLDPVGAHEVFRTVQELNRELGVTIVMASHAAEELAEYADRLVLLNAGQIVDEGPPAKLYTQVELMQQLHLRPPGVTRTFHYLRKAGFSIPELPVTLNQGIAAIKPLATACHRQASEGQLAPAPRDGRPLVSVTHLTHTYDDGTQALRDISLDIHRGEYVLITGQNGAGKSTLVRHFLRLLLPTDGEVRIDGVPTRDLSISALARRVGYVAQNPDNQIFNTTVEQEIAFALRYLDMATGEIRSRTERSMAAMGLQDVRDRHPLSLPRGERARVVIAAILALEPEVVIFDEPTTGQDYQGARAILRLTKQLHNAGKTVIVITHHLYLMAEYAERVIVMGKGTLLRDAPIRVVFHETDVLASTYLTPPQAVQLAQALTEATGIPLLCLTPQEVAGALVCDTTGRSL